MKSYHQLKMADTANSTEAFRGESQGYPGNCNVLLLDCETILEAVPTFSGAALVTLEKPQVICQLQESLLIPC